MSLIPAIICMFILQIAFALVVFYWGIFQRFSGTGRGAADLSMLIFMAVSHLANYLYPVTAGVNLDTTIIPGTFKIGLVRISYQMFLSAITGIVVTPPVCSALLEDTGRADHTGHEPEHPGFHAHGRGRQQDVLSGHDPCPWSPPTICTLMIAPFWGVDPLHG